MNVVSGPSDSDRCFHPLSTEIFALTATCRRYWDTAMPNTDNCEALRTLYSRSITPRLSSLADHRIGYYDEQLPQMLDLDRNFYRRRKPFYS